MKSEFVCEWCGGIFHRFPGDNEVVVMLCVGCRTAQIFEWTTEGEVNIIRAHDANGSSDESVEGMESEATYGY